ncbi:hypothetical protein Ccrd_011993 [Cynara cardunculus var. scolymus]|uniref:Uncharacterized protein n=1 Tax=Cynara cardunculus var. scolymus TaxID=59895 RepID=A0A103YI87_CYNCS|nr:hypothetical protein Ccrd_011993 [Cynara cardunculus var. scolymus]
MVLFAVIPTVSFNVQNVYEVVQSRKGSMLNALAMLVPFGVLLGVILLWDCMSPSNLIVNYPHMVVMGTGLAFGFLVVRKTLLYNVKPLGFSFTLYACACIALTSSLVGPVAIVDHLGKLRNCANFTFLILGRMILSHLCDEPKGLKTSMSMSLFYLPLAIANTLTARLNDGTPLVDEKWVLLGFCTYTAALYLHFATSVIHEITAALGIYCFRITKKEA